VLLTWRPEHTFVVRPSDVPLGPGDEPMNEDERKR
jgi:hypothetical protein